MGGFVGRGIMKPFTVHFGTMGSAKTALLLMKNYNYAVDKGKEVLLLKPSLDNRSKKGFIESRVGIESKALEIDKKTNIIELIESLENKPEFIMVDEIQFFSSKQIIQLKDLTILDENPITVDVYGLKNNFKGNLFGEEDGSMATAFSLATHLDPVNCLCACGNDAHNVARFNPETWEIQKIGEEIKVGGNESYVSLCYRCFKEDYIPRSTRIALIKDAISKNINPIKKEELEKQYSIENELYLEEEIDYLRNQIEKNEAKILELRAKSNNHK